MFNDQPTLVIQGRATAKDMALAFKFLASANNTPKSRSDLVRLAFQVCCEFAKMHGIEEFESNHAALEYLEQYGLSWGASQDKRDLQKVLAFDVFNDLTYAEAVALKNQMKSRGQVSEEERKRQEEAFWEAAMPELEALDRKLRGKE